MWLDPHRLCLNSRASSADLKLMTAATWRTIPSDLHRIHLDPPGNPPGATCQVDTSNAHAEENAEHLGSERSANGDLGTERPPCGMRMDHGSSWIIYNIVNKWSINVKLVDHLSYLSWITDIFFGFRFINDINDEWIIMDLWSSKPLSL